MEQDHVDTILNQWKKERPDLDSSPMAIIGRISRVSRYIDQILEKNFNKQGLIAADFDVLATLRRSPPPHQLMPTTLFNEIMISSGAMTNRLDRLERSGLVERIPKPDDRRCLLVKLTKTGFEKINQVLETHLALEKQILSVLEPSQKEAFIKSLRTMLVSFKDH